MFKNFVNNSVRKVKEEGFTLIELLTVILIIGILSAIAIPSYMKQKQEAATATLKTDLRNGATVMTTEAVKTGGFYTSAIPNYTDFSKGNLMSIVPEKSNKDQFCLKGTNESKDTPMYFSSLNGIVSEDPSTCGATDSPSFAAENKEKKVVIVYHYNMTTTKPYMYTHLDALGYDRANVKEIAFKGLTKDKLADVDLLILANQAWLADYNDYTVAYEFYNNGGKVLLEGNDNKAVDFAESVALPSGGVDYKPTYNSISPPFPYSFKNTAFKADSWVCLTNLKNGAIAVASSEVSGHQCVSMFAAASPSGGRFAYVTYAGYPKGEFDQVYASMTWLMS